MKILYFVLFLSVFSACSSNKKPDVNEVLQADRDFSAMSVKVGYPAAFAAVAHPDAVILRPNSMPVKGKSIITELYAKADTTGVRFTWEPLDGEIAMSGEIGYTYGTYAFTKDTVTERGTYATVWKKDVNGVWKYILDIGNEGLEKK